MKLHAIIAALFLVLVSPVVAGRYRLRRRKSHRRHKIRHRRTVTDIVLSSGPVGKFDRNKHDYDILREAVVAAGLGDSLATIKDITLFAPNDSAFYRLAVDLGYRGKYDEKAILWAIVAFLDDNGGSEELLPLILLYHVVPKKISYRDLKRLAWRHKTIHTLFVTESLTVYKKPWGGIRLKDAATSLKDPQVRSPVNIYAKNGVIHTIDRVLIPLALEEPKYSH